MREQGSEGNDLIDRLAADPRLGLDRAALATALGEPLVVRRQRAGAGRGRSSRRSRTWPHRYPDAAAYTGEPIL